MKLYKAFPIYLTESGQCVYDNTYRVDRKYSRGKLYRLFYTDETCHKDEAIDFITNKKVEIGEFHSGVETWGGYTERNHEEYGISFPDLLYEGEYDENEIIKWNKEISIENEGLLIYYLEKANSNKKKHKIFRRIFK